MPDDGTVDVFYTTKDGTDHAGIDYTPTYGDKELTFSYNSSTGGYASQIVQVDTDATADNGTFSLYVPCLQDQYASTPSETACVTVAIEQPDKLSNENLYWQTNDQVATLDKQATQLGPNNIGFVSAAIQSTYAGFANPPAGLQHLIKVENLPVPQLTHLGQYTGLGQFQTGGKPVPASTFQYIANPFVYIADVETTQPGKWKVRIQRNFHGTNLESGWNNKWSAEPEERPMTRLSRLRPLPLVPTVRWWGRRETQPSWPQQQRLASTNW